MSTTERRVCTLRLAARGSAGPCTAEHCAFWEAGGAVVDAGCVIERLGVDVGRADLAAHLLELREQLDVVRDRREAQALRSRLARRIGLEL